MPSNGGTTSSRTVTVSFSNSQSDNCQSSSVGLTGSVTITQSGDTASFVCYKYDGTTLTKANSSWNPRVTGNSSGVASSAYGYATLTVKRTPKYQ